MTGVQTCALPIFQPFAHEVGLQPADGLVVGSDARDDLVAIRHRVDVDHGDARGGRCLDGANRAGAAHRDEDDRVDLVQRQAMLSGEARLASVLSVGAVLTAELKRGNIIVDLGSSVDSVLPEDLPLFFAQITLTVLAPSRQGQVFFLQKGKPYPAVKADQTVLEPGEPVAWEDYADLIIGDPQPPVATTTTVWGPP